MLQPSRKPDPLMVIGVIAVLVLALAAACVRVEDDDCRDVGMSAVAAPARTGKSADRPAPQLSKAPAVSRAPVAKVPPAARTATATVTARPHRGGHVDLDLCD